LLSPVQLEGVGEVMELSIKERGDRRLGMDRRQFLYNGHIPERRSGRDRRSGLDRRLKPRPFNRLMK
jgi:hypothetical protein